MKIVFEQIKSNPLFEGIGFHDFEQLISCMGGKKCAYEKGAVILLSGESVSTIGIVITGHVQVLKEDPDGKAHLMTELQNGDLFAETFACAGVSHSPATVIASSECEILHLNYKKVITTCPSACPFHSRLVENMLRLLAQKNLMLNQKIEILSMRTTRERLLRYFEIQSQGRKCFTIPLNREALAAFLCVERSAMSAELSKMQKEGILRYHRSEMELLC